MDYENNFINMEQYDDYKDNAPLTPPRDKNAITNNGSSSSTQQQPAADNEQLPLSQLVAPPPPPPPDDDDDDDAPLVQPARAAVALSTPLKLDP